MPHAACHTRMQHRVKWVKNAMAKIKSSAHKLLREKTEMSMPKSLFDADFDMYFFPSYFLLPEKV